MSERRAAGLHERKVLSILGRALTIIVALVALSSGLVSLATREWSYASSWGGVVFTPALVVIGILLLYAAMFRWESFTAVDDREKRKHDT